MATDEVRELLESAAPTPTSPLVIGHIERRVHQRRRRRRMAVSVASLMAIGLLVPLAVRIPHSRGHDTVIAGSASSGQIVVQFSGSSATTEIHLLDGTRLRLALPQSVGRALVGVPYADVQLHGALYADPAARSHRGWVVDVSIGSVATLVPGGDPLVLPPTSRASAAVVDRAGHRLGLQFGRWTLLVTGDSLTDADVDTLLTGVALVETPDGFVEYRGSLALGVVDAPDARLARGQVGISVFLGDSCPIGNVMRTTRNGLESYRNADVSGGVVELCDRVNRLRIVLDTSHPLSDHEIDAVRVTMLSIGQTLAGLQRGEHP